LKLEWWGSLFVQRGKYQKKTREIRNNNNNNNNNNSANVEHEMFCHTSNHWSHRNCNYRTKNNLETIPGKHSIDSIQKNSWTGNITHYEDSATITNLKLEWWGSPLVQEEMYQEKPVKR
jgi:hypothetical protein